MNENAIVLSEARAVSLDLSKSKLLPTVFHGKPSDVLAVVLTGRELGLGPMQSLRGFDIIQGKVSMSSALIGAMIMSSPVCEYLTPIESTATRATYKAKRRGSPEPVTMSFTIKDAELAKLTGKDNYKKNPTAMLLARCVSRIGRAVFPDIMLGVYDRDSGELDDLEERTHQTPITEHVESVKEKLRAAVSAPAAPAADVVEGEVVESKSEPESTPETKPDDGFSFLTTKIGLASTPEQLKSLLPECQAHARCEELKRHYQAQKTAIIAAKAGAQ